MLKKGSILNKKKKRVFSQAEQRRVEQFEKTAEEMKRQGYTRRDLIIEISKANVFSVVLMIVLFVVGFGLYCLVNRSFDFPKFNLLIFLLMVVVLIVAHELIHGICWSLFTPQHFRDIEFGIMRPSFTPYCVCLVPLRKQHHLFGTVMPFVLLGLLPMLAGIFLRNPYVLFLGTMMASGAAGDLMIIRKVLGYKSIAKEVVYMDHPTEAGGVVFER